MADGDAEFDRYRGIADSREPSADLWVHGLALQLQLIEGSESMGDHDSGSDDWWCVG